MSNETRRWSGSHADRMSLAMAIGKFLRTHRDGYRLLHEWLASVSADQTEDQFLEELQRAKDEHEARIVQVIADYNVRRTRLGLPPVNRRLDVIRARNPKQSESAKVLRAQVADVVRWSGKDVSAKVVLRVLELPDSRRRAVSRCLAKLR